MLKKVKENHTGGTSLTCNVSDTSNNERALVCAGPDLVPQLLHHTYSCFRHTTIRCRSAHVMAPRLCVD